MFAGFNLSEILEWSHGSLANGAELSVAKESIRVTRPGELKGSKAADIAYFFSKDYRAELPQAAPGILITGEVFVEPLRAAKLPFWSRTAVVACKDPYLAMALISGKFAPHLSMVGHQRAPGKGRIHSTAVVDPSAEVGEGVEIGAFCVVEAGAQISKGCVLYPHCFIGQGSRLGEDSVLFPQVTVYEMVQIGKRVRIHSGVVIGADGFGYAPLKDAGRPVGHAKIYHFGRVLIGDDVEIGANSCIDRGTIGDTVIENSVKLDDHVMVGHNSHLGEGTIVCGCAGFAGSASVGKFTYIGGFAGISNRIHVGDGASVGGCTLVTKDVAPGTVVVGNPQRSHRDHFRAHAALNRLIAERKTK